MSNIDHNITFVNSSLKVTASDSVNIENDLKSQGSEVPLDSLLQPSPSTPTCYPFPYEKDQKIAQKNI